MAATLKDIAQVAGVSRQAVAAALRLSGSSKVSPELRRRVQVIAAELHYTPNQTAQRLKGAASRTIGIYGVPYASVLSQCLFNTLSVQLDRYGYNLMTCYGMNEDAAGRAIDGLLAKGVDGVIVTTQQNPLHQMQSAPVPSVFSPPSRIDGFDVAVNHAAGTGAATRELLRLGRRRFVYLPPCLDRSISSQPNREKLEGMRQALVSAGLEPTVVTVEECDGNAGRILERLRELECDAVICSNDYFAGRLLTLLLEHKIAVPESMMVIGYDGLSMCDLCAVPLATVVQPMQRMAELTVQILLERIEAKRTDEAPREIALEPYFYPSASCGEANPRIRQLPLYNSFSSLEEIWHNGI